MKNIIDVNSVYYTMTEKKRIIDEGKECFGLSDHDKKTIDILASQEKCFKNKTKLHEIIECINMQYQIGLKHHQIELLEYSFYDTIKRNKLWKLFKE